MIVPRDNHTATLLADGRVLVAGGLTQMGADFPTTATCEIYDPATNSWAFTGTLHEARENHAAILLADGRVLVAGGVSDAALPLKSSEVYNPATGKWLQAAPMLTLRKSPKLALLPDGQVLVAGGNGRDLDYCERFNPDTGKWTDTGDLIVGRRTYEMTRLDDGRVVLAGGNLSIPPVSLRTDSETYDPATGTWSEVGRLIPGRDQHEQVRLADGRVLAAGGFLGPASAETVTRICDTFDPAANTWTLTHPLVVPRVYFTADLLPDGNVFAVGGSDDGEEALASIEEFEPLAGRWHLLDLTLEHPRFLHTATTLLDGSVLIAGGISNEKIIAEAEIFFTPK
ncbi:MAG: kelch repeat-containing protein [Chthoniobacterales bacterium]